ncbi:MAG: response regulator [Bacillota bacterium]|uniref:Stage 0 sporulation protein A homolog n=1 Tax=Thermanaerosceptrum fracticalcis TaxID=1712410 RepID=A0A7G6E7W1_THEFR|nr:response regulator transcription factor [Thermanaerosceptrum fracticalcis]QNB48165.1 response regulator [Thermanaerosceptrum fracticalcis]
MSNKPILLVDDDPHVLEVLSLYLKKEEYPVVLADNGMEALEKIEEADPRLIVLDVMMPQMDGIEVCRKIRAVKSTPIIMLTAKSEDIDKILGLELGADDYITKPFNPREVVARIKAVLRRTSDTNRNIKTLSFPNLEINLAEYRVKVKNQVVPLTPKEIELLALMASHPNMVFTRENLLENVWGYDYIGETRTVDTHVKRLRRKLMVAPHNPWDIKTIWGVGYKFEVK